jgi:bifunctional non-homologous end joining protein LigD
MGGMPRLIEPMMASLRRGLPDDDERYGWEFKWDGVRAIAYVAGGQVRLLSRSGRDVTGSYPELAVLAQRVDGPVIVDGEIRLTPWKGWSASRWPRPTIRGSAGTG